MLIVRDPYFDSEKGCYIIDGRPYRECTGMVEGWCAISDKVAVIVPKDMYCTVLVPLDFEP